MSAIEMLGEIGDSINQDDFFQMIKIKVLKFG